MRTTTHEKQIEKFKSKIEVQSNNCWHYIGTRDNSGYGIFSYSPGNKKIGAHRFSAKYLDNKVIDNLLVCHTCDNPCCVNPAHLFVGTYQDNKNDQIAKGRQPKGKTHGMFGKTHSEETKNKMSISHTKLKE